MASSSLLDNLEDVKNSVVNLQKELRMIRNIFISRLETRSIAKAIAIKWFQDLKKNLVQLIEEDTINKYDKYFQKLLSLSAGNARKSSYLTTLKNILSSWKSEIYIPCHQSPIYAPALRNLSNILQNVTTEESEYLEEALGCANNQYYRASIVLAWCAAISRIHQVILQMGLNEFNKKTSEMKAIQSGRYKKFNKIYDIHNLNELEISVLDTDLLRVIEYWGLIDANQHDRLVTCFTMRNNSAHPGDAGITEDNLISFYSDLKKMIFDNQRMILNKTA